MNAFYRFIIGLATVLLFLAALVSYLGGMYTDAGVCLVSCVVCLVLWEKVARDSDRREQMRAYRDSVWEPRIR